MRVGSIFLLSLGAIGACGPKTSTEQPAVGSSPADGATSTPATVSAPPPGAETPAATTAAVPATPPGTRLELYAADDADCPGKLSDPDAAKSMPEGLEVTLGNVHMVSYEGDRAALTSWFAGLKISERTLAVAGSAFFKNNWTAICRVNDPTLSAAEFATVRGAAGPAGSNQYILEVALNDAGKSKLGTVPAGVKRFVWVVDGQGYSGVVFLKPLQSRGGIGIVLDIKPEQLAGGPAIEWAE